MKPCTPRPLPVKQLDWKRMERALKRAHAALEQFNAQKRAPLDSAEIFGYKTALKLAKNKPITLALIKEIHTHLKPDGPKGERGHFRHVQNWIAPQGQPIKEAYFLPPNPKRISSYLRNWKKYLNHEEKDPLVKIAILVAQFLIIHPFMDGNGRVARTLIPLLLIKEGVTRKPFTALSHFFKAHHGTYNLKLFRITHDGDWEGWILFFLKGIYGKEKPPHRTARGQ